MRSINDRQVLQGVLVPLQIQESMREREREMKRERNEKEKKAQKPNLCAERTGAMGLRERHSTWKHMVEPTT